MCFIRDILFGAEVDKKGCALDGTCRLMRNYSSCLPLELPSVSVKDGNKRWRASDGLERLKCAVRYITSLRPETKCVDYFKTKKEGGTLYGELLLDGKPQKKQLPLLYFQQFITSLFFYIPGDVNPLNPNDI